MSLLLWPEICVATQPSRCQAKYKQQQVFETETILSEDDGVYVERERYTWMSQGAVWRDWRVSTLRLCRIQVQISENHLSWVTPFHLVYGWVTWFHLMSEMSHPFSPYIWLGHPISPGIWLGHLILGHMISPDMWVSHLILPDMWPSHLILPCIQLIHLTSPHMQLYHLISPGMWIQELSWTEGWDWWGMALDQLWWDTHPHTPGS